MISAEFGIDHAVQQSKNGTVILGAVAGYANSQVAFNGGDTAGAVGPSVGAYVDWINGGTYVDALAKADFLSVAYNIGGSSGTVGGSAVGGTVEVGTRLPASKNIYVEPVGNISYVHTSIDSITIGADSVSFSGDSLRAKLGGRLGTTIDSHGSTLSPYLQAYVGNEFMGNGQASLTGGVATSNGAFTGVYGELGAGINVKQTSSGVSAFAEGYYTVADGYNSGDLKAGVRGGF